MSDAINPQHYKRLPAEAIEIIESVIEGAPSNRDALLHGQALKYLLRCWNKNGIEDLKKAKWYLDRLIDSFDESEAEQLATVEATVEVTVEVTGEGTGEVTGEATGEVKLPDGWRWLEVGEVICKGDKPVKGDAIPLLWIGTPCASNHFILRRNRFNIGEKVAHGFGDHQSISVVKNILGDGWVDLVRDGASIRDGVSIAYHVKDLAPYIEESK